MKTIEEINQSNVKKILSEKKIPDFFPGDVVKVGVRITEGKKDRIQYFEGVCIAKKKRDLNSSFTVRKISFGEGVERTFPLYGTVIDTIKVIRSGKVRRAKLYYLRDRTGKSARIAEKIRKKIGIDIDVKPETVTEENLAPVTKEQEVELKTDTANIAEVKIEAPKVEVKKEVAPKSGNKTKNYTGFLDEVVIFKKALNPANAKELSDPKLVLRKSNNLMSTAMHWWRMGDDLRDNIDRSTNSYTRKNRIHDQLNDMHGTPKRFKRRSSGIYEAHPFDDKMMDEFIAIIEEVISLEIFCQLLLLLLFKSFGIDIPKFGGPGGLPKLPTNNPFGQLLDLLMEAVIRLVVDTIMAIFMNLLEQLSVSCDDINKILQGDFAGTEHGKFAENFGDLLDKIATGDLTEISKNPLAKDLTNSATDLLKQTEDFVNETGQLLEDAIKYGTVTKYKDPWSGEERDYSSVLDGFDIVTPNEVERQKSGISEAWMETTDTDEDQTTSRQRTKPTHSCKREVWRP